MIDWSEVSQELARKLNPANVRPPQKFGPKGDFIEGWFAISEANRIFGFGGWSYTLLECRCVSERPRAIGKDGKDGFGVTYTATVRVIVDGVTRDDVGAGHGYDVDCGLAHESAIKEAVTDALKRSLRTFGNPFGLALYDKSRENVGVDLPDPSAVKAQLLACGTLEGLQAAWKALPPETRAERIVIQAKDQRKDELTLRSAG